MRKEKLRVIFLHIGKTAGSSFNSFLDNYYANTFIKIGGSGPERKKQELKELSEIDLNKLQKIHLIKGHVDYGIHELVPQFNWKYITFLRDPVERVISLYYYILNTPQHYLNEELTANNISFEEFMKGNYTVEVSNEQTRLIAGRKHKSSENLLDIAIGNLENEFACVGLTERFEESICLMKNNLGLKWKYPVYESTNINKKKESNISPQLLDIIREANQLDIQLYDYAKNRFESDIAKININEELVLMQKARSKTIVNKVKSIFQ